MRRLAIALALAASTVVLPAFAQSQDDATQRTFIEAMQQLDSGKLDEAERLLRELLKATRSPRVKLELARTLFLKGQYKEAKKLFEEVATRLDTPWRVRDNIANFVRQIDERTGYFKFGVTTVSDSNPRNLAARKEMTVGGFRVTPTEAPKKVMGQKYSVRGWKPIGDSYRDGVFVNASYTDFSGGDIDRITADFGGIRDLSDTGRVRGKAGMEFGTMGGKLLYRLPYVGMDTVVTEGEGQRVAADLKVGKVDVVGADHLDAYYVNAGGSARKSLTENTVLSMSGHLEHSEARERPYTYTGWEIGPAVDKFWPSSTFVTGAGLSFGQKRYAATDPMFGERREDTRAMVVVSISNKRWRVGNSTVTVMATYERNHSNIEFYSYRKFGLSVAVE